MAEDLWTVKRILEWITGYLSEHGDERPDVSARMLVSDALGVSQMGLFLDLERPLSADERATLRDYTKRRAAGEPIQYITGATAFRHIDVRVKRGVLIPRPETEVLVSEALALLPAVKKPQETLEEDLLRARDYMQDDGLCFEEALAKAEKERPPEADSLLVADICTGSGCIACSIAHERPQARVFATDIVSEAVSLARENAQLLGLDDRVIIRECDLGEGIDENLVGAFDLVVSNPPYVPTGILDSIPREVADFEPAIALDGGVDGLDTFRRLLDWSIHALRGDGVFACELHETCLGDAAALAASKGFVDVRTHEDLAGRPRVLTARKKTGNSITEK